MATNCKIDHEKDRQLKSENRTQFMKRIRNKFIIEIMDKEYKFKNKPIKFKTYTVIRERTEESSEFECFYHLTRKGNLNNKKPLRYKDRTYDENRIGYVMLLPKILNSICYDNCQYNLIESDERNKKNHVNIICLNYNYKIVLEDRTNYYLLITAFPLTKSEQEKYSNILETEKAVTIK
ncbi:MAG: hypothetical protein J1F32_02015 [Erysipelotrichales bacterium]|nr:hypothetical protein [Erysipelotrichales bacterium]